jgi:hypothetical protein
MAAVVVRLALIASKWLKAAQLSNTIIAEVGERHAMEEHKRDDSEFTSAEEESAFWSNRFMCVCQLGISALQLLVCALLFSRAPVRNAVNIILCALSLPLAAAGLFALSQPDDEHSVLIMHWYQFFFVLRAFLVSFDWGATVRLRERQGLSDSRFLVVTLTFAAVLILQLLNSLLVMAVVRIMRKRRRERVAAEEKVAVSERTPLLS